MVKRKLTFLQQRFVNNIISGMPQYEAYERAGYKARGAAARAHSSRLVTNGNVKKAIEEGQREASYKAEITAERLLKEEKCLAYSDVGKLFELKNGTTIRPDQLPEEIRRAVAGIEIIETEVAGKKTTKYKYKFWDKGRSLERLEKIEGMFEKDNKQKRLTLEEIFAALPDEFAAGVRRALTGAISDQRN